MPPCIVQVSQFSNVGFSTCVILLLNRFKLVVSSEQYSEMVMKRIRRMHNKWDIFQALHFITTTMYK